MVDAIEKLTKAQIEPELFKEFAHKYGVMFTRDAFSLGPRDDGTFLMEPDSGDPLPPIGCKIKVHGYQGQIWRATVTSVDYSAGNYTATIEK